MSLFQDRADAGRQLAARLQRYRDRPEVLVLALPRGGVPVAREVARSLNAPLDVFVVRKLGTPGQEELAMGAIASGGVRILNRMVVAQLGISRPMIEAVAAAESRRLVEQEAAFRGDRPPAALRDRTVIVVDDGLATGASMRAAVSTLKAAGPRQVVVAVPTAPRETCQELAEEADEVVCAATPEPFHAVGSWYADFRQVTDEEVRRMLEEQEALGGRPFTAAAR